MQDGTGPEAATSLEATLIMPRTPAPITASPDHDSTAPRIPLAELDPSTTPTLSITEAGQYLNLERNAAYRAAKAGYLPTVQLSERRWVVPTAALKRLLLDGAA